ncbi:hypothetical protein AURDEDRAFT_171262 [Auricularia subglabra TFB-10046 SS5]|nr:hypothetical protein AURDEDRAFT_171262 [Auricularia subglabra TFB-10046 SS5]
MLLISRLMQRVAGSYIVNPALTIPAFLGSATTSNLHLESQLESVDATVRVLAAPEPINRRDRIHLVFCGAKQTVVQLHELGNLPCAIEAASCGDVSITLPLDFVGLIQTTSPYPPTLPSQRYRTLSEADCTGKYFIGEWEPGAQHWDGHTVEIRTVRGYITVAYPEPWYKRPLRFLVYLVLVFIFFYPIDRTGW